MKIILIFCEFLSFANLHGGAAAHMRSAGYLQRRIRALCLDVSEVSCSLCGKPVEVHFSEQTRENLCCNKAHGKFSVRAMTLAVYQNGFAL